MKPMKSLFLILSLSLLTSACGLKGGDTDLQSDVDALLVKYQVDLDTCRALFVKKYPQRILGSIVIRVLVAPNGAAYSVEPVEIFKGGNSLADCLGSKMMNWDMGRTGGRDVTLRLTVHFSESQSCDPKKLCSNK